MEDVDLRRAGLVQLDGVDHRVEALVVGAQRLQHLPHDLEPLVVGEGHLGGHAGRDRDGQDDVAVLLARREAHHPAHRLHDVDDALARVEEHHGVQARHVNALGQALGVAEDAGLVRVVAAARLEPLHQLAAGQHVHRAVDVAHACLQGHPARRGALKDFGVGRLQGVEVGARDLPEGLGEPLRRLDVRRERHRLAHRLRVGLERARPVRRDRHPLGQGVPAPDDAGHIRQVQLGVHRQVVLEGARHRALVDGQHEHLVVGEQPRRDRLAEPQTVELRAEGEVVIHRRDDGIRLTSLDLGRLVVQARGGRHVQPLGCREVGAVVHPHERRLVASRDGDPRGAVGLVADDEVEPGHPGPLRLRDDVERLVRREDHGASVRISGGDAGALGQPDRVGRGGDGQVDDRGILVGLADLGVRAHGEGAQRVGGLGRPLLERLVEQGDARHEEEHPTTGWHDLLGQAQAREGLAGAARHDQLPAVVLGEAGSHGVDGGALVRAQLLAAERRQHLGGARVELGPVERGADEVFEADDVDRDLLVLDRRLGGRVEAPGRGHQEAGAERVLARLGEEGVDLPLGQGCLGAEELALHRHEVAGVALAGDEVDAVVGAGAALGPVAPHPHLLEPPGIQRLGDEEGLDEPLEPGALVAGVVVRVVELVEDVVDVDPPGFVAHASTLGAWVSNTPAGFRC